VKKKIRYLLITLPLLLGCDGWTKHSARSLELGQRIDVVDGWLAWTHAENPFIAFSLPVPMGVVLLAGALMMGWLVVEFARLPGDATWRSVGLAAMLAGAIGNLVDRLGDGSVTDMVLVYTEHPSLAPWLRTTFGTSSWPVFNVADAALLLGVAAWIVGTAIEGDALPDGEDPALQDA